MRSSPRSPLRVCGSVCELGPARHAFVRRRRKPTRAQVVDRRRLGRRPIPHQEHKRPLARTRGREWQHFSSCFPFPLQFFVICFCFSFLSSVFVFLFALISPLLFGFVPFPFPFMFILLFCFVLLFLSSFLLKRGFTIFAMLATFM